jgi:hypothetical protein
LAAAAHPPAPSLAGAPGESDRPEVPGSAMASVVLWSTAAPPFLKAVLYPADVGPNVIRPALCLRDNPRDTPH